ncbi:Rpn family recombination-promoting nuclease/putative transposase [Pseudanabaena sp. UWO310]|uniref:Rpn family recombination-promoting nuclease/putative transposase n=1 Tax=Pseudanabaena sp. UWO310 TaxID=2480795 RepID=UPI001159FD8D|nr:Rpn family recombination-promoting nuclease/putative transposase [Pseudanabaena sp. UWO310]TYQ29925.1 Rpn family recombination-promoting nuclease/putative transposase [Pseudanabaena sp. UWO310]
MRRDSIFYKLFQQFPPLLFQLLPSPPPNADVYRFDSGAVKEPKFEIDGVFLPNEADGIVYFCEVQFQKDEQLYERVFAESLLYFYRNRHRFSDWQTVIIYPSRSIEQGKIHPYRALLNSEQVHRIYLNELGNIRELPIWVALMVLTTVDEIQAPAEARYLLKRTVDQSSSRAIIEMVTTIMVYKFEALSQKEVEAMLGITLQETRVYREIKAKGVKQGRIQGRMQGIRQGHEQGRKQEAINLVVRILIKRFGNLSDEMRASISDLSLTLLEELSEAILDFSNLADLQTWLTARSSKFQNP